MEPTNKPLDSGSRSNLFNKFFRYFFSINTYRAILNKEKRFPTFWAILILSLIASIKPIFFTVKNIYPYIGKVENKAEDFIKEIFPEELDIYIKDGFASTNVTEPYYILIDESTLTRITDFSAQSTSTSKVRLLAIDTKGDVEYFASYQSIALLTERSIVYYSDGEVKINSLQNVDDIVINQEKILSYISDFKQSFASKFINWAITLAPLLILIGTISLTVMILTYWSFLIYLILRIQQNSLGFKSAFSYFTAVSFIPSIVQTVLSYTSIYTKYFSSLDVFIDLTILGIAYWGITLIKKNNPMI